MKKNSIFRIAQCVAALPFLPFWHLQKCLKRDKNLWLFGSANNSTDSDNGFTFFDYVCHNFKEVKAVWVTQKKTVYDNLRAKGYNNVEMSNTIRGKRVCLRAGLCFVTTGPTETNKRYINGAFQLFLWHSMPIKIIGNDWEAYLRKKRSKKERFLLQLERFCMPYLYNMKADCAFITSEFFVPYICSAFGISPEQNIPIGQPKNDAFFADKKEKLISQLDSRFDHPTKIVYMPTFRDDMRNAGQQFNPFGGFGFDSEKFKEMLDKNNVVFLYKSHNHDGLVNVACNSERFIILTPEQYQDPYTLLKDVDLLITDYSSVYFDFLLTKKPIILAPFDIVAYQAMRPFYFDYYDQIEGCICRNWDEIIEAIKQRKYFEPSEETCRKFNKYQDGDNCKRILAYVKTHYMDAKNSQNLP